MARTIVTLPQNADTPARREVLPGAVVTCLFDRSRDSRQSSAPGQDFVAYGWDQSRLVFVLCDGVSQSFFGDLAARFLGQKLASWLVDYRGPLQATAPEPPSLASEFAAELDSKLRAWAREATRLVEDQPLSEDLPPMVQDALERKREQGSEAMFVGGLADLERGLFAACWMGDMRLWLWDYNASPIPLPDAVWETRERWSTRVGPKNGNTRTLVVPLTHIRRITAHSDGVGNVDEKLDVLSAVSVEALNALARHQAEQPTSDDITVIDVDFAEGSATLGPPLATTMPRAAGDSETAIAWDAVRGAEWYRVEIVPLSGAPRIIDFRGTSAIVPPDLVGDGLITCRIQAISSYHLPGPWGRAEQIMFDVLRTQPGQPRLRSARTPTLAPASPQGERQPTRREAEPGRSPVGAQPAILPVAPPMAASPTARDLSPQPVMLKSGTLVVWSILMGFGLSIVWIAVTIGQFVR